MAMVAGKAKRHTPTAYSPDDVAQGGGDGVTKKVWRNAVAESGGAR